MLRIMIHGDLSMTGENYVLSGSQDWADEFDVYFFEILYGDTGQKYLIAQEIFGHLYGDYCFGTNQYWDGDFDYLKFKVIKITEEETNLLERLHIRGRKVLEALFEDLEEALYENGLGDIDLYECSIEDFRKACIELHDLYEET